MQGPPPQRISANLPVDVLELGRAEIGDLHLEPAAHLPIGVLRKTNCARLRNALKPRGDIDAVAHQVAVALLNDVANVNPDAEFDSPVLRHARVTLEEAVLDLDRAADRVHDAAKLDDASVAGAFHDTAAMSGDSRVDEVAAQTPQTREGAILVGTPPTGCIRRHPQTRIAASFRVSLIAPLLGRHTSPNASSSPPDFEGRTARMRIPSVPEF